MNQIGRASDISSRHAHRVAPPSAPSIPVAGIFERVVLPQREAVEGVQLGRGKLSHAQEPFHHGPRLVKGELPQEAELVAEEL